MLRAMQRLVDLPERFVRAWGFDPNAAIGAHEAAAAAA
jgi:hypothetical protein